MHIDTLQIWQARRLRDARATLVNLEDVEQISGNLGVALVEGGDLIAGRTAELKIARGRREAGFACFGNGHVNLPAQVVDFKDVMRFFHNTPLLS